MHHGPAVKLGKDYASERKSKLGVKLFFVYGAVYTGFMAINVFNQALWEKEVMCGLNLAVVYGIGLILFAIILGVVYNAMCSKMEDDMNKAAAENETGGAE